MQKIWDFIEMNMDYGFSKREVKIFEYIANKTQEDFENSYFTAKDLREGTNLPKQAIEKFINKMNEIGILVNYGNGHQKQWAINLLWE